MSRRTAEYVRRHAAHLLSEGYQETALLLQEFAKRIKADEGAVPFGYVSRNMVPFRSSTPAWHFSLTKIEPHGCIEAMPLFTHPSAQVAQVADDMVLVSRKLLSCLDDPIAEELAKSAPTAEPVAQGDPRFFIDHTMIHDFRDYVINPGETTRINNPDGISNTCALLNSLAALPRAVPAEALNILRRSRDDDNLNPVYRQAMRDAVAQLETWTTLAT